MSFPDGLSAFLALGSNQDSPRRQLSSALDRLSERSVGVVLRSSLYLTEPVGGPAQPWFLNAVVGIAFDGTPLELLRICQSIEVLQGRVRSSRNGPRTLDLDLLLFGDQVVKDPELELPHPRLPERRFVLVPMVEIAPEVRHPILGLTMKELLDRCATDGEEVRRLEDARGLLSTTA